jgi:hypothetical protein
MSDQEDADVDLDDPEYAAECKKRLEALLKKNARPTRKTVYSKRDDRFERTAKGAKFGAFSGDKR